MNKVEEQKVRLSQKKTRIAAEEMRLKLKERKMRTRHLIEVGGLVVKADLDYLPTNTLYGALLSLQKEIKSNPKIQEDWTKVGKEKFNQEHVENTPIIIQFEEDPKQEIKTTVREFGLRFNRFRSEWYGNCSDLDGLKSKLKNTKYKLEIIPQAKS